ncbi:MAG TPA: DUF2304 domain-containing protein [Candidatus Hungatella pullicola]|nr:DUF2304 domain-containing protein [Candidatus Hungatella pullicola]
MTVALRCVLIVTSVFLTWFMLRKIRQSKIKIEDSIFWIMLSLLLVIFSLFPGLADILSDIVGTYSTSNFIFLLMIFILLMKVFSMSLKISQLERKVTELVQSLALSETKKGEKKDGADQKDT